MQLKHYQQQSLDWLQAYLQAVALRGADGAYALIRAQNPRPQVQRWPQRFQPIEGLPEVPYVCLRLPTGGGKTLLCAHSIKLAADALDRAFPLVLWMMPSNVIKQQTLDTLKNPQHPNHLALQQAFDGAFRVFDIADFATIRPQDLTNKACIVVSTLASLRVEETEGRRAYDHHEELEGHFSALDPNTPDLERNPDDGKIKFSFVNLLHVHNPLILVDESHNAKSELTTQVFQRINPRAVIEYTATPTPTPNSNLLESISAQELKDEEMIKLPIVLQEHPTWQQAVAASLQTRARLETLAAREDRYLRPLLLIQAQDKNGEASVQALKQHLCEQQAIPEDQIVIVTGDQRELDGVNLFDPGSPVRVIITVQALKEGWDCPFAYVLCSVANTRSSIAIEQLLGRVLRMPYVSLRRQAELNQAYAHVSEQSWTHAVSTMTDRLVSMGFEQSEIDRFLDAKGGQRDFADSDAGQDWQPNTLFAPQPDYGSPEVFIAPLVHAPDLSKLDVQTQARVTVREEANRVVLHVQHPDAATLERVIKSVPNTKDRREVQLLVKQWLRKHPKNTKPADRGVPFVVPQLCLKLDDAILPLDAEHCLGPTGWNPLDFYHPISPDEFAVDGQAQVWIVDVEHEKLRIRQRREAQQLLLGGIPTPLDVSDLAVLMERALFAKLHGQYMRAGTLRKYLLTALQDLLAREDMNLPLIIRARPILETLLAARIEAARSQAYAQAFQQHLFADDRRLCAGLERYTFHFPKDYPANPTYSGHMGFDKHYYQDIGAMNAEEEQCALALEHHERVKHWVRNLERQERHAFWLPTATDKFYPDFVAQLLDGRILVVEYKGKHLKDSADTLEKTAVGRAWAKASGNLFLMAFKQDSQGRDVTAQVRGVLG